VIIPPVKLNLSGERFRVTYRLAGNRELAMARANDICVEQTIEFPAELVPTGDIHDHILGQIESLEEVSTDVHRGVISFAVEITGFELKQLINVLFGNISIKPGIRIERIDFPNSFLDKFSGPRFGIEGIRTLLGVKSRPLLCTALKPLGLSAMQLAEQAYQCALGGIDIIKDDHSLANQSFAPFKERVARCAGAVRKANSEGGHHALYAPSLTSAPDRIEADALDAKNAGAGALLICPGLIGLDVMRHLADNDRIALPILSHPAFQGSMVTSPENGIAHGVIFGSLARLAGADSSIFPNFGGRFSFSRDECHKIAIGCAEPLGNLRPIFPTPGGGMNLGRISEMREMYGNEVLLLVGGALHQGDKGLAANCRQFREMVEQF
jgi:ribulose-bisphosphate carboxylase large chain